VDQVLQAGTLHDVAHRGVERGVAVVEGQVDARLAHLAHDPEVGRGVAEAAGAVVGLAGAHLADARPLLRIGDQRVRRARAGAGHVDLGRARRVHRLLLEHADAIRAAPLRVGVLDVHQVGAQRVAEGERRGVVRVDDEHAVED
ncbi:MAG: hypothetical protein ACK56F_02260, partial [bacterium]